MHDITNAATDDNVTMQTTTEPSASIGTLTALDVKAMRQADTVSFHYIAGESAIRCVKPVKNPGPFDAKEREHIITCTSTFRGKLNGERIKSNNPARVACHVLMYAFSPLLDTVCDLIRTGDELSLEWSADGESNGYLDNARIIKGHCEGMSLHADALRLVVRRGKKRYVFLLDVSICPDNTARMIRFV